MGHSHKGRTTEKYLDKTAVISGLRIEPGQTILDAGCGYGYMSREFARALKGRGRVYALDADGEAIESLRAGTEGGLIEAMEADITGPTPLKPSSIDVIYLATVFHGFSRDDIPGFLAEVKRLLKPDGRLAIVEIDKVDTAYGPSLHMRFSPEDLKREVGLPALETVDVGSHFYMQIFGNNQLGGDCDNDDTTSGEVSGEVNE